LNPAHLHHATNIFNTTADGRRPFDSTEELTQAFAADMRLNELSGMADLDSLCFAYNTYRNNHRSLNLSVPSELWNNLEDTIKKHIERVRKEVRENKRQTDLASKIPAIKPMAPTTIGQQYPSINNTITSPSSTGLADALATVQNATIEETQDNSSEGTVYDDDITIYGRTALTEDLPVNASFITFLNSVNYVKNILVSLTVVPILRFLALLSVKSVVLAVIPASLVTIQTTPNLDVFPSYLLM